MTDQPAISNELREFVIEAGRLVPSAYAALNGPLEGKALRLAWLRAIAVLGLTEKQADEAARGAWKRGIAAERFLQSPPGSLT